MSWLSNFVKPKIRALVSKTDIPDNLWHKCDSCEQMLFHRDLEKNLHVCTNCGKHFRIKAKKRLDFLFGKKNYTLIELPKVPVDPLKFKDKKRYIDRLKDAQGKTKNDDAILVAHGTIDDQKIVVAVFDFTFMGGSMGMAVGEGLLAASQLAVLQEAPLVVITSSGGARMQEGILSLMQMPRSIIAVEDVKEAGLPYITVLADPTTGGVSASFAMLGDICLAEPGAIIGFAGRRVIEETIREKLPEDFQKAEYLKDHGMVDMVVTRKDLKNTLSKIIRLLRTPNIAA